MTIAPETQGAELLSLTDVPDPSKESPQWNKQPDNKDEGTQSSSVRRIVLSGMILIKRFLLFLDYDITDKPPDFAASTALNIFGMSTP